tara:strand:- start:372 stop:515 length:144 start_codon:yes stop_codon:yes gene_type:complete
MYQFFFGLCTGIYLGTYYQCKPLIDGANNFFLSYFPPKKQKKKWWNY